MTCFVSMAYACVHVYVCVYSRCTESHMRCLFLSLFIVFFETVFPWTKKLLVGSQILPSLPPALGLQAHVVASAPYRVARVQIWVLKLTRQVPYRLSYLPSTQFKFWILTYYFWSFEKIILDLFCRFFGSFLHRRLQIETCLAFALISFSCYIA